jgi:hypothetical protein
MKLLPSSIAALAALALWPAAALPQSAAKPARVDPLDAKAAVAPLVHRSALAGYRRLDAESPPLNWRAANDAVERIGGWRAYAREANAPASGPSASPSPDTRASRPAPPAPGHRH